MTVAQNENYFYGSANMPEDDVSTGGGAVDFTKLVFFSDISPSGTVDYVSSSSSDTAVTLTATGLDGTGVSQAEAKGLNGTTIVTGSQSFERLMKGVQSGTTPVGDVAIFAHTKIVTSHTAQAAANTSSQTEPNITLQSGDGASVAVGQIIRILNNSPAGVNFQLRRIVRINGDVAYVNRDWGTIPSSATTYDVLQGMLFDISPNRIVQVRRAFYNVAADVPGGSTKTFYEKVFAVNNDTATALTQANVVKQTDPSGGTLDFALCTALNDSATITNRLTAPTGVGSYSSGAAPQTIAVSAPQNLPSGNAPNSAGAQGVWLRWQLAAGLAPAKTSFTMRITGNSV